MKFYNREEELQILNVLNKQAEKSGRMTVITGRRRVGKTLLARQHARDKKHLYFFISKKSEKQLCDEFLSTVKQHFSIPVIGEIASFKDIFLLILNIARHEKIVLIIDEFQEFYHINPSVYSDIQNLWDQHKEDIQMHLLFIGSVYSLMVKLFESRKEPLFGRADRKMYIKPFSPRIIKEILCDHGAYTPYNLFFLYIITGGIPRYLEILADNNTFDRNSILNFVLCKDSPFLFEGKHLLIEELGKEYGTYFSILELISSSKTSRSEIESIIGKNVGGHLNMMEDNYDIIQKIKPVNAKKNSRIQKYLIKDNFLNFWFRFIQKNRSAVETENFTYIKKIVERDFNSFAGYYLEKLFQEILIATGQYNKIGNYWEKGNLNEIDIVAVNDFDKEVLIAEVKLNPDKISLNKLKHKAEKLIGSYKHYNLSFEGFALDDIDKLI
ncbi:ATPase [Desulfamplus magnetovallimortis]|uniref:ATPase n=1 Tax=Desulfamplus magnetovallimortis TaxID=1246637 RepID=A0A1W1HC81_9BACT|nr:ATP-binding protein [Desulfamplus magnetovallimortis]SLM30059.1 ATPase [Desulfamplus magnetovallimortis]